MDKYVSIVRRFGAWLNGEELTKEKLLEYRDYLSKDKGFTAKTVNVHLSAINAYLDHNDLNACRVKRLKIQRQVFRPEEKELTLRDYWALVHAAEKLGKPWLALILQTICSTGIRGSELCFITMEAVCKGCAQVTLKGKTRTIFIPDDLCEKLQAYARDRHICSGPIFLTRNGIPISRQQVWSGMQSLCGEAGVNPSKVFPHNLRHLFDRCFYEKTKDIAKLADVLGHSSIETTRISLISSGAGHAEMINKLGLVA